MSDKTEKITSTEVETTSTVEVAPTTYACSVADGEEVIDANGNATGEKVVYEYDEDGKFIGWHKEEI